MTYVIVALIHVYFTGFALFGLFARISWWRDEKTYVEAGQSEQYQAQIRLEDIVTSSPIPDKTEIGENHVLEKLLSVNLVHRDQDGKARVVLGASVQDDLANALRHNIQTEYMQQKGVQPIELPKFQGEINERVIREIAEMIKVDIDPQTCNGVLDTKLTAYLKAKWQINNDTIEELSSGQSLYRLKTRGLLTDDELDDLSSRTPNLAAKNEIAQHGLHLQLQML